MVRHKIYHVPGKVVNKFSVNFTLVTTDESARRSQISA
jgi:hypothetical protein